MTASASRNRASKTNGNGDRSSIVTDELQAIDDAWQALAGLDPAAQTRSMRWISDKLGIGAPAQP